MTIKEKLAFYQDRYDRLLDPDLWILSGTLFFGTKTEPKPKLPASRYQEDLKRRDALRVVLNMQKEEKMEEDAENEEEGATPEVVTCPGVHG